MEQSDSILQKAGRVERACYVLFLVSRCAGSGLLLPLLHSDSVRCVAIGRQGVVRESIAGSDYDI